MGWHKLASSLLTFAVLLGTPVRIISLSGRLTTRCLRPVISETSIYNFTVPDLMETRNVSLSEYQGKKTLIVNVATYADLPSHYHVLNEIKEKFTKINDDFEILAFPCNQFGKQEPGGSGQEIWNGIKHVRPGNGFEPNFPLFKKIDVNGEKQHPLYEFLKNLCPPTTEDFHPQHKLFYTPMNSRDIRWNFEKILVDETGMPVERFDSSAPPKVIEHHLDRLLRESRESHE